MHIHYARLGTVRAIADDVIVMPRGEIVRMGEKEAVFRPPHDPYTELLLASVPQMDPDWLTSHLRQKAQGRRSCDLQDE